MNNPENPSTPPEHRETPGQRLFGAIGGVALGGFFGGILWVNLRAPSVPTVSLVIEGVFAAAATGMSAMEWRAYHRTRDDDKWGPR